MDIKVLFFPEKDPGNSQIDRLLTDKYYINNSTTGPHQFKSFLLIDNVIAGYAYGKYGSIFTSVSRFEYPRDSILSWIEIFPKFMGKGYCVPFLQTILEELHQENIDVVEIDNIGQISGCRCYLKSIENLGGVAGYLIRNPTEVTFNQIRTKGCLYSPEQINILVFPNMFKYYQEFHIHKL